MNDETTEFGLRCHSWCQQVALHLCVLELVHCAAGWPRIQPLELPGCWLEVAGTVLEAYNVCNLPLAWLHTGRSSPAATPRPLVACSHMLSKPICFLAADDTLLLHVTTGIPQRHLWQEGEHLHVVHIVIKASRP